MASDHVPDPEAAIREGEAKGASTATGLILVALVLAIFGVFFADAWKVQSGRFRPKESPRVEGQLAPIGRSALTSVTAADETTARTPEEKGKPQSPPSPGAHLQEPEVLDFAHAPSGDDAARKLKPRLEPSGKDR
jgi:hypothetical protein